MIVRETRVKRPALRIFKNFSIWILIWSIGQPKFINIKLPILLWSNLAGFGGTAGEAGFGATIGLFELNLGDPLTDPGPELGPGPGLEFGIGQDVCLNTGLPAIGGVFDCTGEELCLVRD